VVTSCTTTPRAQVVPEPAGIGVFGGDVEKPHAPAGVP
jgi:hypothetical protein